MSLKKFNIQLNFSFEIRDLNEDVVHNASSHISNKDEGLKNAKHWEEATHQRRLLNALMEDKEALLKYVWYRAIPMIEYDGIEQLQAKYIFDDREDENILLPIIQRLGKKEIEYFAEGTKEDLLPEFTTEFNECFQLKLSNVTISENE
jgi:hypothetical protein